MNILGIETSCDETAAAVVRDGCEVLTNVVYTQIPLHQPYGGVVPELASRAHIEKITEVVGKAMAGQTIDAVAVTYGPGLAPALIVGVNAAKGLSRSLGVPLIAINHIEAHLHTPFLFDAGTEDARVVKDPSAAMPALGLAISGGHTNWFELSEYGDYKTIGQTLDDAAGEAFDKAAKLLGLGYPGGPKVDKAAAAYIAEMKKAHHWEGEEWQRELISFPKGRPREGVSALSGLAAELCVSFSGLKTALLRYVEQHPEAKTEPELARVITSYQEAIVQAVADRTRTALKRRKYKAMIIGGGVSLNSRMRAVLGEVCAREGVPLLMAKPKYCGDNGAMIAGLAYYRRNLIGEKAMSIDVCPSLEIR